MRCRLCGKRVLRSRGTHSREDVRYQRGFCWRCWGPFIRDVCRKAGSARKREAPAKKYTKSVDRAPFGKHISWWYTLWEILHQSKLNRCCQLRDGQECIQKRLFTSRFCATPGPAEERKWDRFKAALRKLGVEVSLARCGQPAVIGNREILIDLCERAIGLYVESKGGKA